MKSITYINELTRYQNKFRCTLIKIQSIYYSKMWHFQTISDVFLARGIQVAKEAEREDIFIRSFCSRSHWFSSPFPITLMRTLFWLVMYLHDFYHLVILFEYRSVLMPDIDILIIFSFVIQYFIDQVLTFLVFASVWLLEISVKIWFSIVEMRDPSDLI
jgi:hypothetical protein